MLHQIRVWQTCTVNQALWRDLILRFQLSFLSSTLLIVGWRAGRMTAGTVVITGGILATVILLCIIAVLCYCRLQGCGEKQEYSSDRSPEHGPERVSGLLEVLGVPGENPRRHRENMQTPPRKVQSFLLGGSSADHRDGTGSFLELLRDYLEYYCCKNNGSDLGSISQQHFACNACGDSGLGGATVIPPSLSSPELHPSTNPTKLSGGRRTYCPTCSPYDSAFYIRTSEEIRNGGERVTYMPTHYENQALALPLPEIRSTLVRDSQCGQQPEFYTNTRAISTDV